MFKYRERKGEQKRQEWFCLVAVLLDVYSECKINSWMLLVERECGGYHVTVYQKEPLDFLW